ncbi:MAG: CPBP family intramembrane metalloprotease [Thermoleophilia bacterium]|nr:CPBP family intramembrane metalloprotease [Thermoleophilia bacterium]
MSGRLAGWLTFVLAFAGLSYAARYGIEAEPTGERDFFYRWDAFVGALVQLAIMAGILALIVRGGPAARLLALVQPRSWWRAVGAMAAVLVGIVILGGLLNPVLEPGEEQGLVPEEWRPEDAAPFAANFAVTAIAVPVVEELTFRGAGYSLLARYGRLVAIVGTAVLFGLAHGLLLALPILVVFGIGLAWLRSVTGSVYPGILLHGMFNTGAILVGVLG